jgi:hypothetical protein
VAKRSTNRDLYDAPKPESFGVQSRGENKAPQIRYQRPEVARHVARMVIASNMDFEAAVGKMVAREYPEATEAQIAQLARTLEKSQHVRREMSSMLEEIGIGPEALKKLISVLWAEVLGKNDKRWAPAARLMAEITGAAKAASKNEKIPVLRLDGLEAGLTKMLGDAAPRNDADPDVPELPPDVESEEDATGFSGDDEDGEDS